MPHSEIQVEIDSQLCLESKTVLSVAKAQNYVGGGGHRTSKFDHMFILGWGHRTKFQTLAVGRVGGWSGFAKNNATPWLYLAR